MSNPKTFQLGPNAYAKPNGIKHTKPLWDVRYLIMHSKPMRWMFKHPTQSFFRTMEDASAVDLDWFWRGWFYTDYGYRSKRKFLSTTCLQPR